MKNIFLVFSLIISLNSVSAKDILIPAFVEQNGYFKGTNLDYDQLTKDEKAVIESIKQEKKEQTGGIEVSVVEAQPEANAEIVEDKPAFVASELQVRAKPKDFASNIIADVRAKPLVKIEDIFNNASLFLQSQLTCPITPSLKNEDPSQPKNFNFSNNARRKTKSPQVAGGHIIYVKARIRDVNCVPIQGAVVKLWQTNVYGGFNHLLSEGDVKYDRDFVGTATAISDNVGAFSFITILPGREKNAYAPNLNFHVKHDNFPDISTKFFFPDNKFNEEDGRFMSLDPVGRELVTGILFPVNPENLEEGYYYLVDIVLNGVSRFRN